MVRIVQDRQVANIGNTRRAQSRARATGLDQVGKSVSQAGQAAVEFAGRMQRVKDANELSEADILMNKDLDRRYRDITENGDFDPNEFETRWEQSSSELKAELGEKFSNKRVAEAFAQRFDERSQSYTIKVRDQQRRRILDLAGADLMRNVDTAIEGFSNTSDEDVMSSLSQSAREAIQLQLNAGTITEQTAAAQQIKIEDALEARRVGVVSDGIEEQLKSGNVAAARLTVDLALSEGRIDEGAANELRDYVEEKGEVIEVEGMATQIYARAGGDYAQAVQSAEVIEDPNRRKLVKQRLNAIRQQQNTIEAAQRKDALNTAWEALEAGGDVDSLDRQTWDRLGAQTRLQMRAWRKNKDKADASGADRETSLAAYDEFYTQMRGDPVEALNFLNTNWDQFSDTDYKSLRAKASKAMGSSGEIESARSLTQSRNNAMERAGLKKDHAGELLRAYDMEAQDYQREHGNEPPDQWRDETMESLAAKIKIRDDSVWGKTFGDVVPAYTIDEINLVPERHTRAVLRAYGNVDQTTKVSEEELGRSYASAMAMFHMRGIHNPSDEGITEMIRAMRDGE